MFFVEVLFLLISFHYFFFLFAQLLKCKQLLLCSISIFAHRFDHFQSIPVMLKVKIQTGKLVTQVGSKSKNCHCLNLNAKELSDTKLNKTVYRMIATYNNAIGVDIVIT